MVPRTATGGLIADYTIKTVTTAASESERANVTFVKKRCKICSSSHCLHPCKQFVFMVVTRLSTDVNAGAYN